MKMGARICFFHTFPALAMKCRVLKEERQALQDNLGLKTLENEYETVFILQLSKKAYFKNQIT